MVTPIIVLQVAKLPELSVTVKVVLTVLPAKLQLKVLGETEYIRFADGVQLSKLPLLRLAGESVKGAAPEGST